MAVRVTATEVKFAQISSCAGIYEIKNISNGKRYVGSTINLKGRWNDHYSSLVQGVHYNRYLQRAWNKYGEESFEFSPILYCDKENLLFYEQCAIDVYKVIDTRYGYNISPIAGSQLGFRHSVLTKSNFSKKRKGSIPWNKDKKGLQIAWNKGQTGVYHFPPLPEERKQRISAALMGHAVSDETKEKISKNCKGHSHPYKGMTNVFHHSEETKEKMSETHKLIPLWNRGKKLPPMLQVTRDKISKALKGRPKSEETIRKMVAAKKRIRGEALWPEQHQMR